MQTRDREAMLYWNSEDTKRVVAAVEVHTSKKMVNFIKRSRHKITITALSSS